MKNTAPEHLVVCNPFGIMRGGKGFWNQEVNQVTPYQIQLRGVRGRRPYFLSNPNSEKLVLYANSTSNFSVQLLDENGDSISSYKQKGNFLVGKKIKTGSMMITGNLPIYIPNQHFSYLSFLHSIDSSEEDMLDQYTNLEEHIRRQLGLKQEKEKKQKWKTFIPDEVGFASTVLFASGNNTEFHPKEILTTFFLLASGKMTYHYFQEKHRQKREEEVRNYLEEVLQTLLWQKLDYFM
ncbi:MAG: hypothetical protein KC548_06070 [Nanoarchaeota archaeon]|nr:hypothetical protein [Nanoarchaeota archaeon]